MDRVEWTVECVLSGLPLFARVLECFNLAALTLFRFARLDFYFVIVIFFRCSCMKVKFVGHVNPVSFSTVDRSWTMNKVFPLIFPRSV